MIDFTTVMTLDCDHLSEFKLSWPTWVLHRPEILKRPMVVYYHQDLDPELIIKLLGTKQAKLLPAGRPELAQREQMLTPFALDAPYDVDTPWILKLDVDVVANKADPGWCDGALLAGHPVLIAHRWGYTKPAAWLSVLEDWADKIEGLAGHPRIGFNFKGIANVYGHKRITSWCCFLDTVWAKTIAKWAGAKMPVPSHDTFSWYCATRQQLPVKRCNMKRFGWEHLTYRNLTRASYRILAQQS